jgi:hypothetical protein
MLPYCCSLIVPKQVKTTATDKAGIEKNKKRGTTPIILSFRAPNIK